MATVTAGANARRGRRAAIYARYSMDRQSDSSIADQVAICEQLAGQHGLLVVQCFGDRALSGAATAHRPGYQALLAAAKARAFDVLIIEGTSRLSRNLGDLATFCSELRFRDITLLTGQHGWMDELKIGMLGTVAQMQLKDVRDQTIRGQRGAARQGRVAGGLAFGYEVVPGEPGLRRPREPEASVVQRIFAEFAAGRSAQAIARLLNSEGVPGPRAGHGTTAASAATATATRAFSTTRSTPASWSTARQSSAATRAPASGLLGCGLAVRSSGPRPRRCASSMPRSGRRCKSARPSSTSERRLQRRRAATRSRPATRTAACCPACCAAASAGRATA